MTPCRGDPWRHHCTWPVPCQGFCWRRSLNTRPVGINAYVERRFNHMTKTDSRTSLGYLDHLMSICLQYSNRNLSLHVKQVCWSNLNLINNNNTCLLLCVEVNQSKYTQCLYRYAYLASDFFRIQHFAILLFTLHENLKPLFITELETKLYTEKHARLKV